MNGASENKSKASPAATLPVAVGMVQPERWAITALAALGHRDIQLSNARTSLRAAAWGEATYALFTPDITQQLHAATETVDRCLDALRTIRNEVYRRRFEPMDGLDGKAGKGASS